MTSAIPIEHFLKEAADEVNRHLELHLPRRDGQADQLLESMHYSLFAGGKRIRPALALAAFRVCGGKGDQIWLATSALEMIHTFSLIHDDLPCMDDDDLRRGRPTNHKVFGEAMAVLGGDALCILAFELLARAGQAHAIEILATSLGMDGMLGGQVKDILSEGREVTLGEVEYIHSHKTAALIEASLVIGAELAAAPPDTVAALRHFGRAIGLAFQIVDDILDIEQTTETLGKDAGSDQSNHKATWPAVAGLDAAKRRAAELRTEALTHLSRVPGDTSILAGLAGFIINRVS